MSYKVLQLRRDDAATWTLNDPTLAAGELGVEIDTLKHKLGDGVTAWTALGYASVLPGDMAEVAQDAIGAMVTDTNSITLTYDDGTPELRADVNIAAAPGDVAITIEPDGLKAEITAIDLGSSV